MKILGICSDVYITSAVLLDDGKVIAGAAEERFTREKLFRGFPEQAVKFCLESTENTLDDINCIAMGWNPALHLKPSSLRFGSMVRWRGELLHTIPHALMTLAEKNTVEYVDQTMKRSNRDIRIIYVTHHDAHAANAFFLSPFKKSAILTIDGRGESDTTGFFIGKDNTITQLQQIEHPHSLGLFYGTITDFLGFTPHSDEWKIMALAARHFPKNRYYGKIKSLTTVLPDGKFELDLRFFSYYLGDRDHWYSPKLVELLGEPRAANEPLTSRHYEIAQALQIVVEEVALHMLHWLYDTSGLDSVVVSGGFFMNSVFNGKILDKTRFKHLFISSCADDSGTSLGAALYVYHHIFDQKKRTEQTHNYYGPEFQNDEIKIVLDKYKIPHTYCDPIEHEAASLLSAGKIVGWFQGKMEFGQRALGNRSILADPRDPSMKEKVNSAVKYRESFRPFAPSVLEEKTSSYFECEPGDRVPFMEKVCMIRKEKQALIPAVTHFDGSGRLQTVSKETNPRYYSLISEFEKLTGIPIVLNTSFNLKGEPIVCTPTDAIRTFYSCGLDVLIMGNYIITK